MSEKNKTTGSDVSFDPFATAGEKDPSIKGPAFVPGESGTPNNVGQEIPSSKLASDQAEFTGPDMSTFTKNEGKFSEDQGLNYNKGDEVGV